MSSADGTQKYEIRPQGYGYAEPTDAEIDLLFRLSAEPYPGPRWDEFYILARRVVPKLQPIIEAWKRKQKK